MREVVAMSELVTANDLERMGILLRSTAFKMAKAGTIPSYSVGVNQRGVRFRVCEVLAALRKNSNYVGEVPAYTESNESEQAIEERALIEPKQRSKPRPAGDMKNILIKNDSIFVRLHCETKDIVFGHFETLDDARAFRDKCKSEMKELRFFPERYRKVGTISGIPVVALRSHWISQRKEFLEWQRMKLQLERVRAEIIRATRKN
jgi:hypothetical protein